MRRLAAHRNGAKRAVVCGRLLALRIADQNSLFSAFDEILTSILERAAASGALDRGMEDIVADDLWPLPTYQEMLFIK